MTPDESWVDPIFNAAESHAQASGWFQRVNTHEPKNAPGSGLTCAIWVQYIGPVPAGSGLRNTTALLVLNQRIYTNMISEPQDAIDPAVIRATASLMRAFSGDFDFGGTIRNVDLLGATGRRLEAQAGYQTIDNTMYRVMTLTVPCIVNDVWSQDA